MDFSPFEFKWVHYSIAIQTKIASLTNGDVWVQTFTKCGKYSHVAKDCAKIKNYYYTINDTLKGISEDCVTKLKMRSYLRTGSPWMPLK